MKLNAPVRPTPAQRLVLLAMAQYPADAEVGFDLRRIGRHHKTIHALYVRGWIAVHPRTGAQKITAAGRAAAVMAVAGETTT